LVRNPEHVKQTEHWLDLIVSTTLKLTNTSTSDFFSHHKGKHKHINSNINHNKNDRNNAGKLKYIKIRNRLPRERLAKSFV